MNKLIAILLFIFLGFIGYQEMSISESIAQITERDRLRLEYENKKFSQDMLNALERENRMQTAIKLWDDVAKGGRGGKQRK